MKGYLGLLFYVLIAGFPHPVLATFSPFDSRPANQNRAPIPMDAEVRDALIETITKIRNLERHQKPEGNRREHRSFRDWALGVIQKIPELSPKVRRQRDKQRKLEKEQQELIDAEIREFHKALVSRLLAGSEYHPRTVRSVAKLFHQHPDLARKINTILGEANYSPERPVHSLINQLIDTIVFEAALHNPYYQAIELHYAGRYPTDDQRFVNTYAKFVNGMANLVTTLNNNEDDVRYYGVAEWMQFFLSLKDPTPETVRLISQIPITYWATSPSKVRKTAFETHWGEQAVVQDQRLAVWSELVEIDPSALTLIVDELAAKDRSGPERVYKLLGEYGAALTPEHEQRILSSVTNNRHLDSMEVHLPDLFQAFARSVPADIEGLTRFIAEAEPSPELLLALNLMYKRALDTKGIAVEEYDSLNVNKHDRALVAERAIKIVREFLMVPESSSRRALFDGLATNSLLLVDIFEISEDRFKSFLPAVMRNASREFLRQHSELRARWDKMNQIAEARKPVPGMPRNIRNHYRTLADGVLAAQFSEVLRTWVGSDAPGSENNVIRFRSRSCRRAFAQ